MSRQFSTGLAAGRLTDLLRFELKTITTNANGQKVSTWGVGFDEWGEAQRQSEQNCRFVIRYRDISPRTWPDSYRILMFGAIWTIASAVPDIRRTMLIIDCDFSAKLEVTHMASVTREYIDGLPIVATPEE